MNGEHKMNGDGFRDKRGKFIKGNPNAWKPGQSGNSKRNGGRKSFTQHLRDWCEAHGSGDKDENLRLFATSIVGEAMNREGAPGVRTKCIDAFLDRVDPVAKDTIQVTIPILNVHTEVHRTFIDRVNEAADGQPPTPEMVLAALEAEEPEGGNGKV